MRQRERSPLPLAGRHTLPSSCRSEGITPRSPGCTAAPSGSGTGTPGPAIRPHPDGLCPQCHPDFVAVRFCIKAGGHRLFDPCAGKIPGRQITGKLCVVGLRAGRDKLSQVKLHSTPLKGCFVSIAPKHPFVNTKFSGFLPAWMVSVQKITGTS